ncbi:MAG TPA: head decoration protein [Rummeliibacillus sp.]|nr:head decoration protein [Rummeliibacillus sp.]
MTVYVPENLIVGSTDIVTSPETVALSQTLVLGQVVAKDNSGDIIASATPADVYGIIADPVITDASKKGNTVVYLHAEFNQKKIVLPAEADAKAYATALRKIGIYLKSVEGNGVTYA